MSFLFLHQKNNIVYRRCAPLIFEYSDLNYIRLLCIANHHRILPFKMKPYLVTLPLGIRWNQHGYSHVIILYRIFLCHKYYILHNFQAKNLDWLLWLSILAKQIDQLRNDLGTDSIATDMKYEFEGIHLSNWIILILNLCYKIHICYNYEFVTEEITVPDWKEKKNSKIKSSIHLSHKLEGKKNLGQPGILSFFKLKKNYSHWYNFFFISWILLCISFFVTK